MKEPPENIGRICGHCADEMMPTAEELARPPQWFVGRFVKLAFPIPGTDVKERMWVKVLQLAESKDEELQGQLDNDPAFAHAECGDLFEFKRSEIVQIDNEEVEP